MKTLARQGDKAEILERLRKVRPQSIGRWGRMSAHQMICHLSDSIRMATGQKPVSQAASLVDRTIVKWIVLYFPLQWPAGILTSPEIDQEVNGTRPADFTADVGELETLLELVTAQARTLDWQLHPIFGRMSPASWLRWAYLHCDHHLRQFGV
jgi:hypothetical protein